MSSSQDRNGADRPGGEEPDGALRRMLEKHGLGPGGLLNPLALLQELASRQGALPTSVRALVTLAVRVATGRADTISHQVSAALWAGASRDEVLEAIGIGVLIGKGGATACGVAALTALEQSESRGPD